MGRKSTKEAKVSMRWIEGVHEVAMPPSHTRGQRRRRLPLSRGVEREEGKERERERGRGRER